MSQYNTINAGETERFFTVVAKASGDPITSGTVNYYLKCKSGGNAGKWWKDSTQTWEATEQANAMTHEADGHWEIDLTSTPFMHGVRYHEYVKESGDLHVPDGRHLVCAASVDEVDGITLASAIEILLAVLAGKTAISGNDVIYRKRDGSTAKITITYTSTDGERSASVINN